MGEYITDKNKMKFQSQDALKTVENVINEATVAIDDKSMTVNNSPLGEDCIWAVQ